MVTAVRKLTTRQGKAFAAVTVEDLGGTAELTVWPDRYEEQHDLLVHGNVLLARVEVRERGDRLTVAAEALATYDQDAGAPLDFDPAQFVPGSGRRRRRGGAGGGGGWNGNGSPGSPFGGGPGGPSGGKQNGSKRGAERGSESGGRAELHAVPSAGDAGGASSEAGTEGGASIARARPPAPLDGPARLRITMDETTDVAADRRRVSRILRLLADYAGAEPAELLVIERGGAHSLLRLPGVADIDALAPLLGPLLGVLGSAERVGEDAAAAQVTQLAAVAGAR